MKRAASNNETMGPRRDGGACALLGLACWELPPTPHFPLLQVTLYLHNAEVAKPRSPDESPGAHQCLRLVFSNTRSAQVTHFFFFIYIFSF